jgi:hypothetical protein
MVTRAMLLELLEIQWNEAASSRIEAKWQAPD